MTLYHASPVIVEHPDIRHSRNNLDFGRGFYTTSIREQAVKYAERFSLRGLDAYINIYDFDEQVDGFFVKNFPSYDEEWLDFVAKCRKGLPLCEEYDAVSGGIANDKVFNTIDLYFSGLVGKDEALSRLKYEKPNHQMCFRRAELIDRHLHFVTAEKL